MKFCKDCKFYKKGWFTFLLNGEYDKCVHPAFASPIDGTSQNLCSTIRNYSEYCGLEAKLFEPK